MPNEPNFEAPVSFDLSPAISPALAVWPGDTPVTREVLLDMQSGGNLTLSTLRSTVHLGSHADAPSHYGRDAPSMDRRPLSTYIGRCQVIHVSVGPGQRITPADIKPAIGAPRVLLATGTFPDPTTFRDDFAALAPELISHLAGQGVRLVGIDTPSVDLYDDSQLLSHHACLEHDVAIVEGLILRGVPEGFYELIALPLKLVGFDASPVRAILRAWPGEGGRR